MITYFSTVYDGSNRKYHGHTNLSTQNLTDCHTFALSRSINEAVTVTRICRLRVTVGPYYSRKLEIQFPHSRKIHQFDAGLTESCM